MVFGLHTCQGETGGFLRQLHVIILDPLHHPVFKLGIAIAVHIQGVLSVSLGDALFVSPQLDR